MERSNRTRHFALAVAAAALAVAPLPAFGQTPSGDQTRQQDRLRDPTQQQDTAQQRDRTQLSTWDREAEQTFGLGRGVGRQFMTRQEWQDHQQKMRTMTAEERARYREEVHATLQERATARGLSLPATPRGSTSGAQARPTPGGGSAGGARGGGAGKGR